jgi:hypothetical protein
MVLNLVCMTIILALLVASGAIFYGCRMLLVSIYEKYSNLNVSYISFPHFVSYIIFFVTMDLLRFFATDHIMEFLVFLKNPPTDEDARTYAHNFRFFYLFGIELIGPFFFYILEPFNNNSCYARSCINEILDYAYCRYLIKLI